MRLQFLSLLAALTLTAASATAQTPNPAQPAPAPPAATTPAPPAPEPQADPQQTLRPFPPDSKFAYINLQRIANDSNEGKASTAKVKALNDKKVTELNDKNKALQASQQKLAQGGSVLSDNARGAIEKDIDRLQVEIQRFTQDAQAEVQELQQNLQIEFQRKLAPIIQQVAVEKQLYMIFSQGDAGIVWADSALEITTDVIKRFDAAPPTTSAAPKPPAPPPAKPPVK